MADYSLHRLCMNTNKVNINSFIVFSYKRHKEALYFVVYKAHFFAQIFEEKMKVYIIHE